MTVATLAIRAGSLWKPTSTPASRRAGSAAEWSASGRMRMSSSDAQAVLNDLAYCVRCHAPVESCTTVTVTERFDEPDRQPIEHVVPVNQPCGHMLPEPITGRWISVGFPLEYDPIHGLRALPLE